MRRLLLIVTSLLLLFDICLSARQPLQTFPVTVGVYRPDGTPRPDMFIQMVMFTAQSGSSPGPASGLSCQTDANGQCQLHFVAGKFTIRVAGTNIGPKQVQFGVRTARVLSVQL